jgi:hypothetical protein
MNSVVFLLDVYEIEGKNNVDIYLNNLKKRLDAIKVQYKFKETNAISGNQNESFNKIKNMDKSIFDKLFDSVGASNNIDKDNKNVGINLIELEIYDDSIFNINSLGVHQLNDWIRHKEKKEESVPLL